MDSATDTFLASLVDEITQHVEVDAIYLYGSRAKGTARDDSDWDIAVLYTHFEPDVFERAVRPQMLEWQLEKRFPQHDIQVVDLRGVPIYLQFNIIQGKRLYNRGTAQVPRVENAIISDYECSNHLKAIEKQQQESLALLDELRKNTTPWTLRDLYAAQRALQILTTNNNQYQDIRHMSLICRALAERPLNKPQP